MEVNRTIQVTLTREDIEQLIKGRTVQGDGFEIRADGWEFDFHDNWKLVKGEDDE